MPDAIYDDGERLPATHANFLIINGAVLVPTYNQPEKGQSSFGYNPKRLSPTVKSSA